MLTGLVATERVASYLPPPRLASVPRTAPVEVLETVMVTLLLVLVASTRSVFFLAVYSAFCTATVSVTCDPGGLTPRMAVLVRPAAFALNATEVGTVRGVVGVRDSTEGSSVGSREL